MIVLYVHMMCSGDYMKALIALPARQMLLANIAMTGGCCGVLMLMVVKPFNLCRSHKRINK